MSKGVEQGVKDLAVNKYRCRDTKTSDTRDEARSIHQVSRSYRGDMNFLNQSTRCQGCDKKKFGSSIDINFSKSSLNNKNVKHMDPKKKKHTHTHILNKSNQFYISKISQDSLVSIH